jgi:Transglutaminase-like superfamily
MSFLLLRAYRNLFRFEFYLAWGNFAKLFQTVKACPIRTRVLDPSIAERICHAVDLASICYWKEVGCLQRSAATTCLLREYGVAARLVIGAKQLPFKAHAWVEVDGRVVNDKTYVPDIYAVLDRC